jgi:nucleotide-binding universal stress UspA family protein
MFAIHYEAGWCSAPALAAPSVRGDFDGDDILDLADQARADRRERRATGLEGRLGAAAAIVVQRRDLDAARRLIVIGRPAHTSLGSALLGSSAHDLLRDGGVAVVIAPQATPHVRPWTGSPDGEES